MTMAAKEIALKPGVKELLQNWIAAKNVIKDWTAHVAQLEALLVDNYQQEFNEIRGHLAQTTALSTTVSLEGIVEAKLARTLSIEQAQAALLLARHGELKGVLLNPEYKTVSSAHALGALLTEGALSDELKDVFKLKDSKVSFTKLKD
jgi:hypothetical protein